MRARRGGIRELSNWLLLLIWLLIAGPAFAGAADIAKGLGWLQSQVQSDGQLATPSKQATPPQARCESAQTLLRLAGNNAQVTTL